MKSFTKCQPAKTTRHHDRQKFAVRSCGLIAVMSLLIVGCSHQENIDAARQTLNAYTDKLAEGATIFESVKDEESAKAAAPQLKAVTEDLKALRLQVQALKGIPQSAMDELTAERSERMKVISTRFHASTRTAAGLSQNEPTFQAAAGEFIEAVQQFGGGRQQANVAAETE